MNPILKDFQNAINRLNEVIALEKNDINRDSAIKRFELCFDLAWKSVKNHLKSEGIECYSPKACLREAFQVKLIDNDKRWLEMVDDRNTSVHLYKQEYADKIYDRLGNHLELMRALLLKLTQKK